MKLPNFTRRASALITTLMVVVVLTIIVIAFFQSMTMERKTAASYSNLLRARIAAESAQAEAINRIATLMATNPYHAIGYTNLAGQISPILYASSSASNAPTNYYLFSSTNANGLPLFDATNSTAVNRVLDGDTNGWIGSPTNGYRECRAQWVYVTRDPANAHQPNPGVTNYNPYVARYAWWVEDETSKLDLTVAGNADASGGGFRAPQPTNQVASGNPAFQDAVAWKPGQADLGAIPIYQGQPLAPTDSTKNQSLITFRNQLIPLPPDSRALAQSPTYGTNSERRARYYLSAASVSGELAGNGRRRVNLNALVHDESDDALRIASDVDDIAFAISGGHVMAATNRSPSGLFYSATNNPISALLPAFGDRLWPASDNRFGGVSLNNDTKRQIYLTKIAANIRDYIDQDSNPTFVDRNGKVFAGPLPAGALPVGTFPSTPEDTSRNGYAQPWAIGKEAIPYLQKYGWYFGSDSSGMTVDQYLTFFNPSTKNFVAPSGTFLRLFKRLRWNVGGFGSRALSPCEFDLSGVSFPAGQVVVITAVSAPTPSGGSYGATAGASVVRLPIQQSPPVAGQSTVAREEGTRRFGGVFSATIDSRGGSHDWYSHMVWGNSHGYYGGYGGIGLTAVSQYDAASNKSTGQTMRGNDAASHSGDVRSLEEPLAISDYYLTGTDNGDQDQYRFYSSSTATDLSSPVNSAFINPDGGNVPWADYTPQFAGSLDTAYALIRDEPMSSIAELGHIYDPYRRNGNNATGNNNTGYIDFARGGGRTLRIGQPDEVIVSGINSDQQSAANSAVRFGSAWANAAWRLTDVFEVIINPLTGQVDRTTPLAPAQSRGKINLNSVLRDEGAVLRSLLRRFTYLTKPNGAPTTSNRALTDAEIETLITQIKDYLSTKGPFMERGELSQILFFAANTAGSQSLRYSQDRGREELFRRILPLLTTRSNSFSVYAVGQAVHEDRNGKITPQGETVQGAVYRLDPVIGTHPTDRVTAYTANRLYERL